MAGTIGQYMADDWTIIGPDGSVGDKATFLGLVKSETLTHDVMESEEFHIRVYADTAVIIARGISGGKYQGKPFRELEQSSCVFVRQEGQVRLNTPLAALPERSTLTGRERLAEPAAAAGAGRAERP